MQVGNGKSEIRLSDALMPSPLNDICAECPVQLYAKEEDQPDCVKLNYVADIHGVEITSMKKGSDCRYLTDYDGFVAACNAIALGRKNEEFEILIIGDQTFRVVDFETPTRPLGLNKVQIDDPYNLFIFDPATETFKKQVPYYENMFRKKLQYLEG